MFEITVKAHRIFYRCPRCVSVVIFYPYIPNHRYYMYETNPIFYSACDFTYIDSSVFSRRMGINLNYKTSADVCINLVSLEKLWKLREGAEAFSFWTSFFNSGGRYFK